MSAGITWFPEQVFADHSDIRTNVPLQAQQKAVAYLRSMLRDENGTRVLLGAPTSGKSTIIRQFVAALRSDVAVAVIDGSGLVPNQFLVGVLAQFGYHMDMQSPDDLLRMVHVFAVQQTRASRVPILIVENIENMRPDTLRTLCVIAAFAYKGTLATRIVLTGKARARCLLGSRGMAAFAKRVSSLYEIESLSMQESMLYLHGRLTSARIPRPDSILPKSVCEKIHNLAHGNPGKLNEIARGTLERAVSFPTTESDVEQHQEEMTTSHLMPKLIVTSNGETIEQYIFKDKKVTLGRSSLADIVIHNEYASKFHALMLLYEEALVLVDLNSSNGTFVNSAPVSSTFLRNDDIVSLTTYRIKIANAPESNARRTDVTTADTSKMKTLEKMREERKMKFPFHDIIRRVRGSED